MNIGIDVDGVLNNYNAYQKKEGKKYFKKKIINPYGYDLQEMFGITKEEDHQFWKEHILNYATKFKARPYASKVIKKLRQNGHKIIIITARSSSSIPKEDMHNILINWLKENQIEYDELIMTNTNKAKICLDKHIDIMIEDSPDKIIPISKNTKTICFYADYNKFLNVKNMIRVKSWKEVEKAIKKERNNHSFSQSTF